MIRKWLDLTGGFWWAVLLLLTILLTDDSTIRLMLSLPLVLLLTGHTALRAIQPVQITGPLEHWLFAAGASIAICVGGGFVLNLVSLLNPVGWAIWFIAINGVAGFIAVRQPYEPVGLPSLPRIRIWHAVTLCAAVGITVSSYWMASYIVTTFHEFRYTQFWLAPKGIPGKLVVGIQSQEDEPEEYDIEVTADKVMIAAFRSIELAPGEEWGQVITLGLNQKRVEANLYRTRDHALYRKVSALTPGTR
jgi:uncharacterized membrane protein